MLIFLVAVKAVELSTSIKLTQLGVSNMGRSIIMLS